MQKSSPKYRINYQYCKQKDHYSQKTNLVCLYKECNQNSLICSFCVQEKHKGHQARPLKHFLQNLQRQYHQQKESTFEAELQELEHQKYYLLNQIRSAVQNLASKFMNLQHEVILKYELIKSQILQKQARKNRFSQFYHTMATEGKGDPTFEIQNYLQFQPLYGFNLTNDLQKFTLQTDEIFKKITKDMIIKKKDYLTSQKIQSQVQTKIMPILNLQLTNKFILSKKIKQINGIYSQTTINTKQTLGYLNTFLKNLTGKIRIRIVSLPKVSTLVLGIGKLQDIIDSNFQYPLKTMKSTTIWMDSKGKSQNVNYNHITSINDGNIIDILVKKNHCKISSKSNICDFILPDKQNSVFFFSLQGISQIQITYPFNKN